VTDIDNNSVEHNTGCPICGSGPCFSPVLCGDNQPQAKAKPNGHAKMRPAYSFRLPGQFTEVEKEWLFKNTLARGEASSWIGAPGGTKSMLLTDIAVHGATGREWRGRRCKDPFGVIYFALERGKLTERRISAYKTLGIVEDDTPLAVVSQVIDLCDQKCVLDVVNTVHSVELVTDVPVGLLIFDTYNKGIAAGGVDENSAFGQNRVAANMRRILERLDVHIAGIGHTGKNAELGERGSNARKADVDLEVHIGGYDGIYVADVTKANDQDEGRLTAYSVEPVILGTDPDGDEIRTFIINPNPITVPDKAKGHAIPPRAQLVLTAIREAVDADGMSVCSNYVPTDIRCANLGMVRNYWGMRTKDTAGKNDFSYGLNWLKGKGLAGQWGEWLWIKPE
jgi:hypothetical protein